MELENGYVLSPKDLKTIDFLDKMTAAGVTVFKIEGRARGADYVRTVTTCYDEALKAIADGTYDAKRRAWDDRLATVFNRGFWARPRRKFSWDGSSITLSKLTLRRQKFWRGR